MTNPTRHGIRIGDKVTITHTLPGFDGVLTVVEIVEFDRLVLHNADDQELCYTVNDYDARKVKPPLPLAAQAGRYAVRLSETLPKVFYMEVTDGSGFVDPMTRSYGDEAEARDIAYMITETLRSIDGLPAVSA